MPPRAKKARKKAPAKDPAPSKLDRPEIRAIILIGSGLLLLLSLLHYSPADLPVMGMFKSYAAEPEATIPRQNIIGVLGTVLGLFQMQLLGAASYLIPGLLIWFGIASLLGARLRLRTILGAITLVILLASMFQVFSWFSSWQTKYNLPGPGGWIGYSIGFSILQKLLSTVGASIILICAYLICLILVTGFHPIPFTREIVTQIREWLDVKAEQRRRRMEAESRTLERKSTNRAINRRRGESEPDPISTAANSKKKSDPDAEPIVEEMTLPLKEVPAPQIIDSSQRRAPIGEITGKAFERPKKDVPEGLATDGFENYELPGFDLLDYEEIEEGDQEADTAQLLAVQNTIVDTLKAFGVEVTAGDITRGPTITRYEIYPSTGLRVSRITQLEQDLARATKAERINILAPIPGKDTVGIEIANDDKVAVPLRELVQDDDFRSAKKKIPLALGKDVYGNTVIGDLAAMPHLLVAGATGSGKSVCINSIITSILFKFSPDELRFIMVDPKVVEMQVYSKLPHLVVPVVTDPKKVVAALRWTVNEMERRYKIFAKEGVRNFDGFNARPRPDLEGSEAKEEEPSEDPNLEPTDPEVIESVARAFEDGELGPAAIDPEQEAELELEEMKIEDKLPYIVVIIDELADLMQTAPADVEMNIARIAQKARAAGIHLIVATQTPRADVVTGIIKANIPSRIAFQVSSALDSRVILDTKGADKLVGKGDMLFLPPGSAKLERSQGAFVSDEEVERIVDFCSSQGEQKFEKSIQESIEKGGSDEGVDDVDDADEEMLQQCIECIIQEQKASTSLLQRRLRLGYTRAARMMDILEQRGVIGPGDGAKPRDILIGK